MPDSNSSTRFKRQPRRGAKEEDKVIPRIALYALILAAQAVSTAQIMGTVKDQSGAVLPGVEISVVQTDTGLKRSGVTDETGSYVLTNPPVGPYRLEATL